MNSGKPRSSVLLIYGRYSSSFAAFPWALSRGQLVDVDTLSTPEHPIRHSVWVRNKIHFHSNEDFPNILLQQLSGTNYDSIICIDEPARSLLFGLIGNQAIQAYLPFPDGSPLYEACQNKVLFQHWCEKNEIPIPKAKMAYRIEEISQLAEELGFPCVIKGARGSGGQAVFVIENKLQLEKTAQLLSTQAENSWVVQEFVTGNIGSTTFISQKGIVYAHCSSEKFVCIGGELGPSAIRRFGEQKKIGELALKIASAGNITGITGFDWIRTASGEYKVIDPHFGRCTSSLPAFYREGLEVDQAFHASLTGGPQSPAGTGSGKIVWMMPQALELVFKGGLLTAVRSASPLRKDVSIFWCGHGEWRMLLSQFWQYSLGQAKVFAGGLRQRLKRK